MVDATVMASLQNMAGVDTLGQNLNRFVDAGAFRGLHMTTRKVPADHANFGSLALGVLLPWLAPPLQAEGQCQ